MRVVKIVVLVLLLGCFGMAQQSLGDLARQQRTEKKNQRHAPVISNDELPPSATVAAEPSAAAKTTSPENETQKAAGKKDAVSEADQSKLDEDYRQRVKEQKAAIALLERELTVSEREHKLQVAAYYGDAGNRLRDTGQWAKQEQQYQEETNKKKQALEDAQKKLDDIREEGRKAGASPSVLD